MVIFISALAKHCLWSGFQTVPVVLRFVKEISFFFVVAVVLVFRWCWRLEFFCFFPFLSGNFLPPVAWEIITTGIWEKKEVVKVGRRDAAGCRLLAGKSLFFGSSLLLGRAEIPWVFWLGGQGAGLCSWLALGIRGEWSNCSYCGRISCPCSVHPSTSYNYLKARE